MTEPNSKTPTTGHSSEPAMREPKGFFHRSVNLLSNARTTPSGTNTFAGRLGGNQAFVLDRTNPINESLLTRVPDAAPNLSFAQAFDLRGFAEPILYKAGMIELCVTTLLVFATDWFALSPNFPPNSPTGGNSSGPLTLGIAAGAVQAGVLVALSIYGFGSVSGAHFNPLITIGTFFARLTTFPRMVIYVGAQVMGATLAGLMLRAGQQSREWKVGGCFLFEPAPVGGAFALEIMGSLLALFLAFGVGLDPRQRNVYGLSLAPMLVGLAVTTLALSFSLALPGYGGASLNPTRCFGAYVGSHFPMWHWIHWVSVIAASAFHGFLYFLVPPETFEGGKATIDHQLSYMQEA